MSDDQEGSAIWAVYLSLCHAPRLYHLVNPSFIPSDCRGGFGLRSHAVYTVGPRQLGFGVLKLVQRRVVSEEVLAGTDILGDGGRGRPKIYWRD